MKITVFGEILWDVFEDEKKIGGAPFNFAAHALKLGADVDVISAVGSDEPGKNALKECEKLHIGTEHIAVTDKPTGYCAVTLKNAVPDYDLVKGVAYDYIKCPEIHFDPNENNVLYFGTLALRNACSRNSFFRLVERFKSELPENSDKTGEIFFDINIRQDYYSKELIDSCLCKATILKISREEIGVLNTTGSLEEICRAVLNMYPNIKLIVVTMDSEGSFVYRRNLQPVYSRKPHCRVVSTVGAGDSFSAAFLVSLIDGLSIEDCLEKATTVSEYVCSHTEAIPD